MLKNYFLIAWRNLARGKGLSLIKIAGLSLGLAVCLLILLYTKDEISYDRFHKAGARLYRVDQTMKMGAEPASKMGITNPIVGEVFAKEIPEVESFVRINDGMVTVKKGADAFTESTLYADSNFFQVFSFPLLEGNAQTTLRDIHSVVLSEDAAKKYFGKAEATGQTMQLKTGEAFEAFTVTAVAKNPPQNSTVKFGMLLPFEYYKQNFARRSENWAGGGNTTFLLLRSADKAPTVEKKMQAIFDKAAKEEIAEAEKMMGSHVSVALNLQPLTQIHLNTNNGPSNGMTDGSSPVYSYLLSCLAVIILLMACINFVNLAIAQSLKRSKEIGVRKVMGGSRGQLIKQFLTESFVVSSIAFAAAVLLVLLVLPYFNALANKKLSLSYLLDGGLYAAFFLLLLLTSFVAGFYPALVLSRFQPVKVLYNKTPSAGKTYFTKGLMVLQFALSIFLVIGAVAVYAQLNFLQHKALGYDSNNLVMMQLPFGKNNHGLVQRFKNELAGQSSILNVAVKSGSNSTMPVKAEGRQIVIDYSEVDENFLPAFKIPLAAGRNFSSGFATDVSQAALVNESFAKEAGWQPSQAIGKTVRFLEGPGQLTIIGVVKDYHFASLKEKLKPQLIMMDTAMSFVQLWVRISDAAVPQTVSLLERTYKSLVPFHPWDYKFMTTVNAEHYAKEAKWKQIIGIAAGLFVFISCIGLFGLVLLSIRQRTKEIGIRKVLGAAATRIVLLITKDFVALIALAFIVAMPLAYYAVNKWLQDFPYRIAIGWWMFAAAGLAVMMLSLLTMSYQSLKAATANPVKSLRTE